MSVAFSMATPVMISSGPSAACDNILYLFCSKCINFMLTVIRMNISGRSQAALDPKLIMTGVAIEKATDIKFFLHITALLIALCPVRKLLEYGIACKTPFYPRSVLFSV